MTKFQTFVQPSILYVPASKPRAVEKARALSVGAVILDLEDAVHPDEKNAARTIAAAALRERGFAAPRVVVRINGHDTPFADADYEMVRQVRPDAVLVPKVDGAADIERYAAACEVPLWAMVETPLAVLNIRQIVDVAGRHDLEAFVLGANDLAKDMDLRIDTERTWLLPTILQVNIAARAFGLNMYDSVFNDFTNEDGLRLQCQQARNLGLAGKTLIHPSQIPVCEDAFAPNEDEVARAKRLIHAFEQPENVSLSVISINGEMFERLHLSAARTLVTRAGG